MRHSAFIVAAVMGSVEGALAATINVGSGDSIQNAIDGAASGDEIVVAPGAYYEAIDFAGKAITLRSSGGPEVTVIDASGLASSVVTCQTSEGLDTVLDGFTITGGEGTEFLNKVVGGGMYNFLVQPTVRNCVFTGNVSSEGGGMWNYVSAPTVTDCMFVENTTVAPGGLGGAGMFNLLADVTLMNCSFSGNSSGNYGGAMNNQDSDVTLINCELFGNASSSGAGIYHNSDSLSLVNCTLGDNTASSWGGGAALLSCVATVSNSIFWGNSPEQILEAGATTTLEHCDIMGGWDGPGSNNSDTNPMFVDPDNGDYRLLLDSPCVNAGDNTVVPAGVDTDLDGNPRVVDMVDLGPYESQDEVVEDTCPWDNDGAGTVDVSDLLSLLSWWDSDPGGPPDFDGSGNVDVTDLLELLANWGSCP